MGRPRTNFPPPWKDPSIPPTHKWCNGCKVAKPRAAFYVDRKKKQGIQGRCIECNKAKALAYARANPEKCRARHREWLRRSPREHTRIRDRAYKRSYGYTLQQYDHQLALQGGSCPICGRSPDPGERRYALDHDHNTGKLRGILCSACNGGLGCFKDDVDRLLRAAAYLAEWRRKHTEELVNG